MVVYNQLFDGAFYLFICLPLLECMACIDAPNDRNIIPPRTHKKKKRNKNTRVREEE